MLYILWLLANLGVGLGGLPKYLIMDFDPAGLIDTGRGVDGDLAFLQLAGTPLPENEYHLAITVTFGNAPLAHTAADSFHLLELTGLVDILPRYRGSEWGSQDESPASKYVVETVHDMRPHSVIMLSLGPLRTLATSMSSPKSLVSEKLRLAIFPESSLFGMGLDGVLRDQEAARTVLEEGTFPKLMVPQSECGKVRFDRSHLRAASLYCPGSSLCEFVPELKRLLDGDLWRSEWNGRPLDDIGDGASVSLCAVLVVSMHLNPHIFESYAVTTVDRTTLEPNLQHLTPLGDAKDMLREIEQSTSDPSHRLRQPYVIIVPVNPIDEKRIMLDAVKGMRNPLHAEPFREMRGAYQDRGFFHPHVWWPIVIFSTSILSLVCLLFSLTVCYCCRDRLPPYLIPSLLRKRPGPHKRKA